MWPKVLLELAPHLVKFVPAANRFLQDREAGDEGNRKAMEAMSAELRGELAQVTAAHAGLYRQIHEQAEMLAAMTADVTAARLAVESVEGRLARMQRRTGTMSKLLIAALVMNFVLILMVFALFFRH
jgi:chromosome segregation ATPase